MLHAVERCPCATLEMREAMMAGGRSAEDRLDAQCLNYGLPPGVPFLAGVLPLDQKLTSHVHAVLDPKPKTAK